MIPLHISSKSFRHSLTIQKQSSLKDISQKFMEGIEHQFENFFNECKKEGFTEAQMKTICRPLLYQKRWRKIKRLAVLIIFLLFIYYLIGYTFFEYSSWLLSAIGRLLLMQILPFWNWTPLYTSKCLIERETFSSKPTSNLESLGRYETDVENCMLCEHIERIPTAKNTTYSYLEANYLELGLPVIITDSHNPKDLKTLLDIIQSEANSFLQSEPCDLATNIMLKKLFNLEVGLQKIRNSNLSRKWFLQLRNCEFQAVKASRLFITRPYYYPLHLEPFYTSWLLMANDFVVEERRLYLRGLIFVQQLSGSFDIQLNPKQPCNGSCPIVNIQLTAGECLVFSTDIWIFHYSSKALKNNVTSLATILEINWQL